MINILYCGAKDGVGSKSWALTTKNFHDHLAKQAYILAHIDYQIKNKLIKKAHKIYSQIILSGQSSRDPFICYFTEKRFSSIYRKLILKPDVFLHVSNFFIPKNIADVGLHVLYTDAAPLASSNLGFKIHSSRYLKHLYYITRKYAERTGLIFTFNQWTKQSLEDDFEISSNKIINIGFGANLLPYKGTKNYDNGLILTVLRKGQEKNKGLYLLLEAFQKARVKNKNISLAVVGTTSEKIDGVYYYENCPRSRTIELFHEASLFAMPALFEPNGMVFPEALACKTPIIGLNRLAFPEFAGYGKYGFIVDKPDAGQITEKILQAVSEPERLEEMGKEGQKFAIDRYHWDKVVQRMLKTIETKLAG